MIRFWKRSLLVLTLALVPAAAQAYELRGYGTFHAMLGFHTWGGASISELDGDPKLGSLAEPSLKTSTTGGFYLSGHTTVMAEWIHVGGYFSYQGGELSLHANGPQSPTTPSGIRLDFLSTVHDVAVGASLKLAGQMVGMFWFGLAMDVGPAFLIAEGERLSTGFRMFPRVTFDFFPWKLRQWLAGVTLSVGLQVDAYAAGELHLLMPGSANTTSSDFAFSAIRPVLMVGGTFGI
jgi:hypothetical protein